MHTRFVLALVAATACSSSPKTKDRPVKDELDVESKTVDIKPKAIDPCAPSQLGLGAARPLAPWAAPADCTARTGPSGPTTITTEDEFAERFACPKGTTSGLDFAKQQLVVEDRMLSPAGAGTVMVDDGATVTFIERDRSPCAGDPQPMPIGYTLGFVLPAGAKRAYASRSCTLPPNCG